MSARAAQLCRRRLLEAFAVQTRHAVSAESCQYRQLGSLRTFAASAGAKRAAGGPVNFVSLGLTAVTATGLIYFYQHLRSQKAQETIKTVSAGKAAIGGPFELVDGNGAKVTDRDLLGQFALLYFGFTFCPDICPDELEKMAKVINSLEKSGQSVRPVFISIDPERDSPQQVKQYVKEFHPRMLGLTGSVEQVKQAARAYRVYFTKTDDSEDYLVDHSIIMYLIDPEGSFVSFYGKNYTEDQLIKAIGQQVSSWKKA